MSNLEWSALNRRTFLKAAGAAVVLGSVGAGLAACGGSSNLAATTTAKKIVAKPDGDLLLFNWAQYMDPTVISGFEKEYGVKVNESYFDNMDAMMAKLNAGVQFDVTFPENSTTAKLVQAGKLMQIDHDQLKNWQYVQPYFQDPWYDPKGQHSIPYSFWTTGIGWRSDKLGALPASWDVFWNTKAASGKIWLLDDSREVLGMSLMRLGYDVNSIDSDQIAKATDALSQLMPHVRGFSSVNNQLINGTSWLGQIWSGQQWQALLQVENPNDFQYATVAGQTALNNDAVVIPANAPHPGTALLFLDWILNPDNVKANVNYTGYPQATQQGIAVYDEMVSNYPFLKIDTSQISTSQHFEPLQPQALALVNEAWLKVKAA